MSSIKPSMQPISDHRLWLFLQLLGWKCVTEYFFESQGKMVTAFSQVFRPRTFWNRNWISVNYEKGDDLYIAGVQSRRFGISSGMHFIHLGDSKSSIEQQAQRHRVFLSREHFKNRAAAQRYAVRFPWSSMVNLQNKCVFFDQSGKQGVDPYSYRSQE